MSKYIDKDKVLEYIIFGVVGKDITCGELTRAIDSIPTIEVSEDCISREWVKGICEFMLDEEMLGHMLGYIEEAPSVVPICQKNRQVERAEGEWVKSGSHCRCSECGYLRFGSSADFCNKYIHFCENCGAKMKG